jgi:hypothetical protein
MPSFSYLPYSYQSIYAFFLIPPLPPHCLGLDRPSSLPLPSLFVFLYAPLCFLSLSCLLLHIVVRQDIDKRGRQYKHKRQAHTNPPARRLIISPRKAAVKRIVCGGGNINNSEISSPKNKCPCGIICLPVEKKTLGLYFFVFLQTIALCACSCLVLSCFVSYSG